MAGSSEEASFARYVRECDACTTLHPTLRCTGCRTVFYCSQECQKRHWKGNDSKYGHKIDCAGLKKDAFALDPAGNFAAARFTSPIVVLAHLGAPEYFDKMYNERFLPTLSSVAPRGVIRATTKNSLLYALSQNPRAVLLTTADIPNNNGGAYTSVTSKLWEYANQGGRVVLGTYLPNEVLPMNVGEFFADMGLPWGSGEYRRYTHHLVAEHALADPSAALDQSYSMKALMVKYVRPGEALYLRNPRDGLVSEAAVTMARVGQGWIGWHGDVNPEAGSAKALMRMLGLS